MVKNKKTKLLLLSLVCAVSFTSNVHAKTQPSKKISIPAKVNDVIFPTTSEALKYFDKLGKKIHVPSTKLVSGNDIKIAMNLGINAADGAAALKNKDAVSFGIISNKIMGYAKQLKIDPKITDPASQKITTEVAKGNWKNVERELDKLRAKIILDLKKQDKKVLGSLASASGWVEGLYIITETIKGSYNSKFSSAFYTGDLIKHTLQNLNSMPSSAKNSKEVKAIAKLLPKVEKIVSKRTITQNDFNALNKLSSDIRNAIIN